MIVGTLSVKLLARQAKSLKDKRQVVQSIKAKLRNAFNVSVAEISDTDHRQIAELGFAMVYNETHPIKIAFGEIVEALRAHPAVELLESQSEIF